MLVAFVLSLRVFNEFDVWIFLKTGRIIFEQQKIPLTDTFSMLAKGREWTHVKWGYSLMAYMFTECFKSPSSIVILQGLVSAAIVFVSYLSLKILRPDFEFSLFSSILVLLCLGGMEYRFLARPEMISHFFTALYLSLFLKGLHGHKQLIWVLLPLQVLWANMHDAFVVGWVMGFLFLGGALIQRVFQQKTIAVQMLLMPLLLPFCSCLSVLGFDALSYPFNLLSQLSVNQFTPELFSFTSPEYWMKKEPFIMLGLTAHFLISWGRDETKNPVSILCVIAFMILGLRSYRNIAFFMPVVLPCALAILPPKNTKYLMLDRLVSLLLIIGVYGLVTTNNYYKIVKSKESYGLGYSALTTPIALAEYMRKNKISSEVFSDYISSAYLLYALDQDFESYLDLRDLDVFTPEEFKAYHYLMTHPEVFTYQLKQKGVQFVALYLGDFLALHAHLMKSSVWQMMYIDHNMVLYKKAMIKGHPPKINTKGVKHYQSALEIGVLKCFSPWYTQETPLVDVSKRLDQFFKLTQYDSAITH